MIILGIETSCDDTGLAIYDTQAQKLDSLRYSQVIHSKYGGIIPEYASRDHSKKCIQIMKQLFHHNISLNEIELFAYTKGPGLLGSLLVGTTFSKSLAFSCAKPAIGINHLKAHLLVAMNDNKDLKFPFVGLLISGGHTLLLHVKGHDDFTLLGGTQDDAVGECFDKTAKLLGFEYPGGPKLSKLAKDGKPTYKLPKPMLHDGLNFSFSGLKTAAKNIIQNEEIVAANLCASLEETISEILLKKAQKAMMQVNCYNLVVAGGVAANDTIRKTLTSNVENVYFPILEHCTDNGAMIAFTGSFYNKEDYDKNHLISVKPRWPFTN